MDKKGNKIVSECNIIICPCPILQKTTFISRFSKGMINRQDRFKVLTFLVFNSSHEHNGIISELKNSFLLVSSNTKFFENKKISLLIIVTKLEHFTRITIFYFVLKYSILNLFQPSNTKYFILFEKCSQFVKYLHTFHWDWSNFFPFSQLKGS